MALSFRQELVAVFGHPVAENPTQAMVEAAFHHHDLDWRYLTIDVAPDDLAAAVAGARAMGFRGFHCTIPHKVAVLGLLDRVGEHWRLLYALAIIYDWLCPQEREFIPGRFRRELQERERLDRDAGPDESCRNVLLDSRPWLATAGGGGTEENHPQPPVSH